MNLVDIVHKLWNNDGRDRPWGYAMPVYIVSSGNLDEEDGDALGPVPVQVVDSGEGGSTPSIDTTTITQVAAAASATQIVSENATRKVVTVYNDSSAVLTLALKGAVSSTSFTLKMQPGDYYEAPGSYNGPIYGLWASATGYAYVTEIM